MTDPTVPPRKTRRELCYDFARLHPTPAVHEAIVYAEMGRLTWKQIGDVFSEAAAAALDEVGR